MAHAKTRHLPRELDQASKAIATTLQQAGFRSWIVGGAVRDLIVGRKVSDLDMASKARPEEIEALFEHTIGVGKAFGTMVVVINGVNIEVTTFRADGDYRDGRHPESVSYSETPEQDASRRDFTCNAMFLDPLTDELLDPTGGKADLQEGILRTVGDAKERFSEDALRLLRLTRFASRLNLEVTEDVRLAAMECADGLRKISPERILAELTKVLTAQDCHIAIGLMQELGLLLPALPGLQLLHSVSYSDSESLSRRIESLEWLESDHLASGLSVLLDPLGGSLESAKELLLALRPSKELVREVEQLWDTLTAIESLAPMGTVDVEHGPHRASRLEILGRENWPRARDISAAFGDIRSLADTAEGGHLGKNSRELSLFAGELTAKDIAPEPLLTPKDLGGVELPRGPLWGQTLKAAYTAQLEGTLSTREQALAWLVERAASSAE